MPIQSFQAHYQKPKLKRIATFCTLPAQVYYYLLHPTCLGGITTYSNLPAQVVLLPISVTRFGKICKVLVNFLEFIYYLGKFWAYLWSILYAIGKNFIYVNCQMLKKYLAIWSHLLHPTCLGGIATYCTLPLPSQVVLLPIAPYLPRWYVLPIAPYLPR